MKENNLYDKKSIRAIVCEKPDWNEIAKDCVAFANAQGGVIDFGIEDDSETPPIGQTIDENLPIILMNKIKDKTINVATFAEIINHENGAQYLRLHIYRGQAIASTTSGKYFLRIADNSEPVTGSDIVRLSAEKGYYSWETQPTIWSWHSADSTKLDLLIKRLTANLTSPKVPTHSKGLVSL